jgi:hypothetical protein
LHVQKSYWKCYKHKANSAKYLYYPFPFDPVSTKKGRQMNKSFLPGNFIDYRCIIALGQKRSLLCSNLKLAMLNNAFKTVLTATLGSCPLKPLPQKWPLHLVVYQVLFAFKNKDK